MASPWHARHATLQRNLCIVYCQATPEDIATGLAWYPAARRIVQDWSAAYGVSVETVACVIAALSPLQEWGRNLSQAEAMVAGRAPTIRGLASNERKARAILQGREGTTLRAFPHGPKVYHFACNLAGDTGAVTVDTHAIQAACHDVQVRLGLRWQAYAAFAAAYQAVAMALDLAPCDFQAIIWHTWKRLYPRMSKLHLRRRWHVVGMEE
jgi:hypothetical protein